VKASYYTPADRKWEVDEYVKTVNALLVETSEDYNLRKRTESFEGVAGPGSGLTAFVGLGAGFFWLRRWRRRSVAAHVQELAEGTETEFAKELQRWPERVDLKQSADVERMLKTMEMAGTARRTSRGPIWLFHRLCAPF
jgi:hypothetical protein